MSTVPSRRARLAARSVAPSPAVAGFRPAAIAVAAAFALGAHAQSVPIGAVHGTATFDRNGNNLLVTTTNGAGNRSVINWQTFGVPGGSTTYFQQPDAASTSINRVTGGVRSDIFGSLASNGRLVLVNPSGIAIGAGASIDTAGFTASTLRLSQDDAIAGRLLFQGGTEGITVGEGAKILAHNGDIVLVGSQVQVERNAVVRADGATILAAGEKVEITGRGLEGIRLEVRSGNQAVNLGTLQGDAVGIFAETLKHSGMVQAQAVSAEGGKVVLRAIGGDNLLDGTVVAAAQAGQGGKGGSIDLLGNRVGLLAGASVDASGANGGGAIRIGGDYQGGNPDVPNAQAVYVDAAASIQADATVQGDGGRVIVWSDGVTRMRGAISARGGAQGGDGGFVEVSGKGQLAYTGTVDLRAMQGRAGTLLLDPQDIVIYRSGDTAFTSDYIAIGNLLGGADFTYTGGPSFMSDAQINSQLSSSNLTITTKHDPARYGSAISPDTGSGGQIAMNSDASITWSTPNKLEFLADKDIQVSGAIYGGNAASSLAMTAKAGDIVFNSGSSVTAGSMNLQAQGGGSIDASATTLNAPGDIVLTAANNIRFGGIHTGAQVSGTGQNSGKVTLTATAGSVSGDWIYTYGDYRSGGNAGNGGDVAVQAAGGISINAILAYGGNSYELTPTATTTPAPSPIPPGSAGKGGKVKLAAGGNVSVDAIQAGAGSSYGGSSFPSGAAGTAGSIDIQSGGDIAVNAMDVSGGYGLAGTAGGQVTIRQGGNLRFNQIEASGGGSYGSAKAGKGGTVDIAVTGTVTMTPYNADDAINADGGSGGTGAGGGGGSVSVQAGAIQVALQAATEYSLSTPYYDRAFVSANGGDGGNPSTGNGGAGGKGGSVRFDAAQPLVMDPALVVSAWGGDGGNATSTGAGVGGVGGAGGTVDFHSASTVNLRGSIVLADGGQGGLASDGVTQAAAGALGTFTASGTSVEVEDNFILGGNWTNNSVVNLRGTSAVFGTGVFKNASDVNLYDTTYLGMASVENAGNFRTFGSRVGATLAKNTGLVEVNGGSTFDAPDFLDNAGTLVVNGTLNIGSSATTAPPAPTPPPSLLLAAAIGPGAVFTNQASGTIAGNGTMNVDAGTGTVDNFGTLAPGGVGAVGALTINGNLAMESGSTYAADIVTTSNHDTVVVSGSALGGGQFAVTYQPGTFFLQGQSFRMIQSGVLAGGSLPAVNQAQLASAFGGNDVLLVATADYVGGMSSVVQSATGEGINQVVTFADLFVKMAEEQEKKRIGKDDIVVTDTACTR
jgi:filamentous hemagglutinin family protein